MLERTDGRIHMRPLSDWEAGTFEGAEYEALRRGAAMSFQERLEWIEQVTTLFTGNSRPASFSEQAAPAPVPDPKREPESEA